MFGHIIPDLSIASLFGIRVLTDVGCIVTFDIDKCVVKFKGNEILRCYKDAMTDLWYSQSEAIHVRPPNMTQPCLCWPAPRWPMPTHVPHPHPPSPSQPSLTQSAQKPTALNLPINPSVALNTPPSSKQSDAGSSKGARISP